jgi:hypothetical protein
MGPALLPHSQVSATCPYPEPARSSPYPYIQLTKSHGPFPLLTSYQSISPGSRLADWMNVAQRIHFYGEELLAPRPNPMLEDHPLSAVRDCLFNIFATTLHIGGRSSSHKVTGLKHCLCPAQSRLAGSLWRNFHKRNGKDGNYTVNCVKAVHIMSIGT